MGRINNYTTALWLVIYLPKMAYLWVVEYWKMLATAIACALVLLIVSYNLGSGETAATHTAVSATSATYDGVFTASTIGQLVTFLNLCGLQSFTSTLKM